MDTGYAMASTRTFNVSQLEFKWGGGQLTTFPGRRQSSIWKGWIMVHYAILWQCLGLMTHVPPGSGVMAPSFKVPIKPPVHVLFTHNCNSWISQFPGWSEDWARRGEGGFLRLWNMGLHSSSRQSVLCAVRLNMDHCHCIAWLSPAQPGSQMRSEECDIW